MSMTLDAQEVIPAGHDKQAPFPASRNPRRLYACWGVPHADSRVRHFGFLANRTKKHALPQCRKLLGLHPALPEIPNQSAHDLMPELTGIDISRCPRCHNGTMIVVAELPPQSGSLQGDSS